MSLRFRLTIGAAFLAALSALSVAAIGYLSTQQRVNTEINQSLANVLQRFTDPDNRLVDALCKGGRGFGDGTDDVDAGLLGGTPGVTLQCIDANNAVRSSIGPTIAKGLVFCRPDPPGVISNPVHVGHDKNSFALASLRTRSGYCIAAARSLEETERSLHSVRNRSAVVGLVVTLVAGFGGLLAARQAIKPIERLTRSAEHIALTYEFDVKLPAADQSEVGRLAAAFGAMLAALRISKQQQQQLVQDASHELRTPLTSIRTNIDTLDRYRDIDDAMRERIANDIRSELEEMNALIEELIVLGTDGTEQGVIVEIDLANLVSSIVERWRQRTEHPITLDANSTNTTTQGRVAELTRAISNLIDNAVKFSPPGCPIDIAVRGNTVEVRDHGVGINDEDIAKLFDRFYRATSARSLPGSGLGLAIVAQIAELHGGRVSARNHEEGGAVFQLSLPPFSSNEPLLT